MTGLPLTIGAALTVPDLAAYLEWLRDGERDLELQDFWYPNVLLGDWTDRVAEAKRLLAGWRGRLGIHGPFVGLPLAAGDPGIREVAAARLDRGLDICAALDADQMVIHSPITTWDDFNRGNDTAAWPRLVAAFQATLRAALARAEAMGVTLVLENVEDRDPGARVALVREIGSAALKVSLDTGHAHYAHGATGGPPVDYYVRAAGDLLEHVHLQDADGHADRHWPPGEGSVPWAAVFRALADLGSRPRLVLEMREPEWVARGAAWLVAQGLAA